MYWEDRARLRQLAYDRKNNLAMAEIDKAYNRATTQLNIDIDTIFSTYQRKTGLSADEAFKFLDEGIPPDIYQSLLARAATVADPKQRKQLYTTLRAEAYKARITRIQAIQDATYTGMTEAADVELRVMDKLLRDSADMGYSRMMYDIQSKTGVGFQMVGVPSRGLDTILKSKWSGTNYAVRVWQNRDAMAGLLNSAMLEQVSIGELSAQSMKDLRGMVDTKAWAQKVADGMKSKFKDETQYAKYAANRLVRTESAYAANQTTAIAYDECEIDRYEFLATLDGRTSPMCQEHDGLINPGTGGPYITADKEIGVNWPPLHPFCRSSTAPVLDTQDNSLRTRAAQGRDGKTVKIPRSMNYQSWKAWQDAGAPDLATWRDE